jgi:hypothetical protein
MLAENAALRKSEPPKHMYSITEETPDRSLHYTYLIPANRSFHI